MRPCGFSLREWSETRPEARYRTETRQHAAILARWKSRARDTDGYTILVAATSNFVINQFLMKMSFDPLTALTPVAKIAEIPIVFCSNPSVPARTSREFVAYARAHRGKLNYGSPGNGSINHLLVENLKQVTGIEITHIPYRGFAAGDAGAARQRDSVVSRSAWRRSRPSRGWQADGARRHRQEATADAARRADGDRSRLSRSRHLELVGHGRSERHAGAGRPAYSIRPWSKP